MFKNEDGFTLIEMLIVLMIITVLILLIIPNLSDKTSSVHDKGCEALKQTVQAQVNAYELEEGVPPTGFEDLIGKDYITAEQKTCKNGKSKLKLSNGIVTITQ